MKTFKTVLATVFVTIGLILVLVGKFLFDEGIVSVEQRVQDHSKVVMIDGEVTEETFWNELLGYTVSIDVVDSAYFGK